MSAPPASVTHTELQDWLCAFLAAELRVPGGTVDPNEAMSSYGLDSVTAFALLTDIEEKVGFELDPNALWDFPTVAEFTTFLVAEVDSAQQLDAAPAG